MQALIDWCFHSPRRLFALVLVAVAVVLGVGAGVRALAPASGATSTSSGAVAAGVPDSGAAVAAAVAFTRAWASKPADVSADRWRQQLSGLVTPQLAAGLAQTDPASLPGGRPTGTPTIRFMAISSALIEVPLSSGRPVLVTVVVSDRRWLATDVEPLAGNAGDAGNAGGAGNGGSAPAAS